MHAVAAASPYILFFQWAFVIGFVKLLEQFKPIGKIGTPAVSLGFAMFISSVLPFAFPSFYHWLFPDTPVWDFTVRCMVIATLGGWAGREIKLDDFKVMVQKGGLFVGVSILAPALLSIPIGFALSRFNNPFIQENASLAGVVIAIASMEVIRALPSMIGFFIGNGWDNDLKRVSLFAASLDDIIAFVLIQPITAGIMSGNGAAGIVSSGIGVVATLAIALALALLVHNLPKHVQYYASWAALLLIAGSAEMFFHVHIILGGIFWGMFMPHDATHKFEEDTKGVMLNWGIPLFFAGLGVKYQFNILTWEPWALMVPCFLVAYIAHEYITAPIGSKIFGSHPIAGKILAGLCRTHGTADVLLAVSLFEMGILTSHGLTGIVLYLMFATIQGFNQAQSLVDKHPELAAIRIQTLPLPEEEPTWIGQPIPAFAAADDDEDR